MGEEDGCDGSPGIYFVYQTQMTKTKEKTMKQYQANLPWTKLKKVFCFTLSVSSTLDKLLIHLVTESVHLIVILGISKSMALATMSRKPHECWELRNWSPSTRPGHFIQFHSCKGICFSCMYTNKYEHFHKWFGTFYRDSVLMKACIFNNHKLWSLS